MLIIVKTRDYYSLRIPSCFFPFFGEQKKEEEEGDGDSGAGGDEAEKQLLEEEEDALNSIVMYNKYEQEQARKNLELLKKLDLNPEPEITDFYKLLTENQRLRYEAMCIVCFDRSRSRAFLPCAHLCVCHLCSPCFRHCPLCKTHIRGIISAYRM